MSNQSLSKSQGIIQAPYPSSPQAAGMIIAFGGSSAPSGWAICDGSELPIASYGQLYGRIGTTWNLCTNPLTGVANTAPAGGNFRLPDLRGTFLRGVGSYAGSGDTPYHSDNSVSLGAFKVDQFQGHQHALRLSTAVGSTAAQTPAGTTYNDAGSTVGYNIDGVYGTPRYGKETNPKQVGVNYLIKLYDDAGAIVMSGSPFVGSEFQPAPITITGNNTLEYSKFYTCDSATPTTQTLPTATGSNKVITIENTNTGLLTVDGNASETINGSLNQVIGQYQSLKVRDYAVGKWIVMH